MRVDHHRLSDAGTLRLWAPGPAEIQAATITVLADAPPLPVCQVAATVDGDELVCGDAPIVSLSPQQTANVRRTATAINAIQHGQLTGALMLVAMARPESLRAALEGLGWPLPEQEMPADIPPEPRRYRKTKPESAASGESADPRPARASILAVVDSLSADPAGALELLEAERQAIGSDATARGLGLSTPQALNAVCRRLRGMVPAPTEVAAPVAVLQVAGVAPAVEAVPAEEVPADPAAERRRRCREAQAKRRARLAERRAELLLQFTDPGRRRWLLRQALEVQERGEDPVAVFAGQVGLPVEDAARVLRSLGCSSSDRATA